MKKIIGILILFVICITTCSVADTRNGDILVSDFEVNKIFDGRIHGNFSIENLGHKHYNELYYTLHLVPKEIYEKNINIYLSTTNMVSSSFSLTDKEDKLVAFEFEVPIHKIPYKEYVLLLKISNEVLDLIQPLTVYGIFIGNENLDRWLYPINNEKTHYYKIKNFEKPLSGPYRDINDPATIYINLKSTFNHSIKVKPKIEFYKRNQTFSKEIYVEYGKEITLKTKESKEIAVKLPDISVPESYYYIIQFIDENGNEVSDEYNVRCVVNGDTAKIAEVNTTYDITRKALRTHVTYIGSSDSNTIEDVEFINGIYETNTGKLLDKYIDKIKLLPGSYMISYTVGLPCDGTEVTIYSILKKGENVLASKNVKLPPEATLKTTEKFTDIKETKYEKPVKILNSFGIISGYPDGTFKAQKTLTRAELTSIALNMLKVDLTDYKVTANAFNDVPENHWAYKSINYAYENGIINGYGNGLFKPNNQVRYSEALAILINTIGYKSIVESTGETWPNNYILTAKNIGIVEGTNIEDFLSYANRGEVSILTLNSYMIRRD